MCAPSEKFLNMGGPLAMGFGVVFMASIGMIIFLSFQIGHVSLFPRNARF